MKKFLWFVLGTICFLIVAVTLFLATFNLNSYRNMIASRLTSLIGRTVTIGQMETKVSWVPTIKIKDIRIANPAGFPIDKPFINIDTAEATLAVAPLFSKRIEIQSFTIGTANVNLMQQGDMTNWQNLGTSSRTVKTTSDSKNDWQFRLDTVSAKAVKLSYQKGDQQRIFALLDVSLKSLKVFTVTLSFNQKSYKISGTVDDLLNLLKHKADYLFNIEISGADATAKLSGSIGDTEAFKKILLNVNISGSSLKKTMEQLGYANALIPAKKFNLSAVFQGDLDNVKITKADMTLDDKNAKIDVKGSLATLKTNPTADLTANIVLTDQTLGQTWGLLPFTAEATLTVNPSEVDIKNLIYRAARSDVQAIGKLNLEESIPYVKLAIASEYLDIQELFQPIEEVKTTENQKVKKRADATKSASENSNNQAAKILPEQVVSSVKQPAVSRSKLIPNTPVSLSILEYVNGIIDLKIPHLRISDKLTGYIGIDGSVTIKDKTLTADQLKIDLLDGTTLTDLSVQAYPVPHITLSVAGERLNLDLIKPIRRVIEKASVDFKADLTASGADVATLIQTLNGTISAEVPQGTIINPWFNELVDALGAHKKKSVSFSTSDQLSKLLCGTVNLVVKNGQIISQNKIAIETPDIGLLIGGVIALPKETVNLTVQPFIRQLPTAQVSHLIAAVAPLIQIDGTFSTPWIPSLATDDLVSRLTQTLPKNPEPYQLCEGVLGHPTTAQLQVQAKKTQMLPKVEQPQPAATPQSAQEKFKQQLLDSLQALQK